MCKLYKKRISVEEPRVGEEDRNCWEPELMFIRVNCEGFTGEEITALEEGRERARGIDTWERTLQGQGLSAAAPRKSMPACGEAAGGRVTAGDRGPEAGAPRGRTQLPSLGQSTFRAAGAGLLAVGRCETSRRVCLRFRSQGVAAGTSV